MAANELAGTVSPETKSPTLFMSLWRWLQRVTQPHPSITSVDERPRAALLVALSFALAAVLSLASIISIFTSIFFPDPSISLGLTGTLLVMATAIGFTYTYVLSRRANYRLGAWSMIVIIYGFITFFVLLYQSMGTSLLLGYMVPVLVATIFLPVAGTLRVFVVTGVLGTIMLLTSRVPIVAFAVTIAIILVVTLLTVIVALLRDDDLRKLRRLRELEAADAERLRHELELARKVQLAMQPKDLPEVANLELAAYSQPAYEASGDFYDVFDVTIGDRTLVGVVVCDVAGKGVAAALIMSATRAALRAEAERTSSPAAVLRKVNEVLSSSIPAGSFVTLFYGVFDPRTSELRFASAGHPHPYLWTGTQIRELESFGMPLGLVHESEYEDNTTHLAPGHTIFIYTDGLVEALNSRREMYGFDMVQNSVEQHARALMGARELITTAIEEMETFTAGERQQDDVTIVVMRVKGSDAA